MIATGSIFFDINLPNATTWFYFSALLAVALFFKLTRLLSIRNWDVFALFLPMPGFLLLDPEGKTQYWGYLWLAAASGYFLLRCLFDLTLVRRPALSPNLNFGGLAWLAGTLFVSLIAVAVRHPNEPSEPRETAPVPIDPMRRLGEKVIKEQAPAGVDQRSVEMWVERGLTVACHLAIAVALVLIGWQHFDDLHAGMACATFYLLLPYTYLLMPHTAMDVGRWDHAWPMALMIWMVLCYRRPTLAGIFLGLATGTVFFPVLIAPLWWSFYRQRGALRFGLAFVLSAGLCLAVIGGILWINGELPRTLLSGWKLSAWLPWQKPDAGIRGLWQDTPSHWAYRLPIFLVYITFVGTTAFWPSPKNLGHVIALTAAILLGIQFWYADQGGVYVLWYLPLLLLLVFRPNLSACQPQPPATIGCGEWAEGLPGLGCAASASSTPFAPAITSPASSLEKRAARPETLFFRNVPLARIAAPCGYRRTAIHGGPRFQGDVFMSRILRVVLGIPIVLALIAAPIAFAVHQQAQTRNFRVVRPGVLYRSGQLTKEGLKRILNDYRIRTVVNLRDGQTPTDQAEEDYCKSEEVKFVRIKPNQWGDVGGSVPVEAGVRTFREVMSDPKNYPVLVHCFAGIHRTGAYCAVYRMEFEHWTNARAIAEMKACGYTNLDEELDILGFMEQYRPGWMPKLESAPAEKASVEVKEKPKTKKNHGRKPSAKGRSKRRSDIPA